MKRFYAKLLPLLTVATVLLAALSGPLAWAADLSAPTTVSSRSLDAQTDAPATSKTEIPGVMDQHDIRALSALAQQLSQQREWLHPNVVKLLTQMDLRLDEVFQDAAEVFVVGEQAYRLKLAAVGQHWAEFDPRQSAYVVFLSQEAYTGVGSERVLAYFDGKQRQAEEKELQALPAIAISLHKLDEDDALNAGSKGWLAQADLETRISLGTPVLELKRPEPFISEDFARELGLLRSTASNRAACVHQAPLSSCSAGVPVCATGQPYFVANGVLIKTDHEGILKGNPEIELYPLNADGTGATPLQGTTTTAIFDGRYVIDAAGRSRYLPDVNNNNQWYNLSDYAALTYSYGYTWYSFLVEQDDTTGVFKSRVTSVNAMNFTAPGTRYVVTINPANFNFFKTVFKFLKGLIGTGDGDDIYAAPIGIGNALSCATLGSSAQNPFILDTTEWSLRGYYACIDPACIPLDAQIQGPTQIPQYSDAQWSAAVTGGSSPFTYRWYKDGQLVGSSSSVNLFITNTAFVLNLQVTDADGSTDNSSIVVSPINNCGPQICLPDY